MSLRLAGSGIYISLMAHKLTLATREELYNHLGYEPRHLAHRHRITRAEAEKIVAQIGPDRRKLDAAATALKHSKSAMSDADS